VQVSPRIDKLKRQTKLQTKTLDCISANVETTALRRPIDRERRQHGLRSGTERSSHRIAIRLAIVVLGQKLKGNTVVPVVEILGRHE
jgi:hypothetical protein